jgi:dienelactone hydrolase
VATWGGALAPSILDGTTTEAAMTRIRPWVLVGTVVLLLTTACGSDDESADPAPAATTTTSAPRASSYAPPGPYPVGYTTLRMDDRLVDVWYPAAEGAADGKRKATYDQKTPLPPNLRSLVPRQYNAVVTMDAYSDVAPSDEGPFPVVLFSHGLTAYRMASSGLLAGVASWGFVVVSADYLERGVTTQLPGQTPATLDAARDERVMLASLDRVSAEAARRGSVLDGLVDETRVAAVGHSAGGTTAFDALDDPRVKVAVGWAPAAPSAKPPAKPTMIIGASGDLGVAPSALERTYASLAAPKRRVEIGNAGHNSFTDLCVILRSTGGMVQYAIDQGLVPAGPAKLLVNGCEPAALSPKEFWPVVQHYTVAELRSALGIDAPRVGFSAASAQMFPGVSVTYEEQP